MEPAVEPITIRGRYFWRGNDRFLVRGVVYQLHDDVEDGYPPDPIADDRLPELRHDVGLFKELGVNTIFVYPIDNTKSHDQAMKMLEEAGIYVLAQVPTSRCCINRLAPYGSYNADKMRSFFRTVDALARYPNTPGILAAHLLINSDKCKSCAPVISAVVRDLKRYTKIKNEATGQRILPVGYAAATTNELDRAVLDYLSSGDDQNRIDFWTCTGFTLGGGWGTHESDYKNLIERFESARLPIFFSEYGGVARRPRVFEETLALYSPQVTKVFSGGCVYEFYYGSNRYGLVKMHSSVEEFVREDPGLIVDYTRKTDWGTLLVHKDFENYKARLLETREIETDTEGTENRDKEATMMASDQTQASQKEALPTVGHVPETCVNWAEIEEEA